MLESFSAYPYLLSSMALFCVAGGLLALSPRCRNRALLSGLMSMPTSLMSFVFVPEYWQPTRLFGSELGVEDLLFSFATGVVW